MQIPKNNVYKKPSNLKVSNNLLKQELRQITLQMALLNPNPTVSDANER